MISEHTYLWLSLLFFAAWVFFDGLRMVYLRRKIATLRKMVVVYGAHRSLTSIAFDKADTNASLEFYNAHGAQHHCAEQLLGRLYQTNSDSSHVDLGEMGILNDEST